jgi:hypothetical protein
MESNTSTPSSPQSLSGLLIPCGERRQFILLFTLLTGLSLFIGVDFANSPYNLLRGKITGAGFEEGLIWGAMVGTAQWFVLRKYRVSRAWIIVTALGCAISMFLATLLTFRLGMVDSEGNVFVALWLGFAPQWFVLSRYVKRSWIWIWISLLPAVLAATLWTILIPTSPLTEDFSLYGIKLLIVKISQSLIFGVITATGLCLFRRRNLDYQSVSN